MSKLDELLAKQKARYEAATPTDVEVLLGDRVVTVVIPFMMPRAFDDFAGAFPPRSSSDRMGLGYSLDDAARNYPGIVIRDGDEESRMLTAVDEKTIAYGWPAVYDVLSRDDRQSIRAVIWGTYTYGPAQEKAAAKLAAAAGDRRDSTHLVDGPEGEG